MPIVTARYHCLTCVKLRVRRAIGVCPAQVRAACENRTLGKLLSRNYLTGKDLQLSRAKSRMRVARNRAAEGRALATWTALQKRHFRGSIMRR